MRSYWPRDRAGPSPLVPPGARFRLGQPERDGLRLHATGASPNLPELAGCRLPASGGRHPGPRLRGRRDRSGTAEDHPWL